MSWWIICLLILLVHVFCGLICTLYFMGGSGPSWTLNIFEFIGLIVLGPAMIFLYICSIIIVKIDTFIKKIKRNERKTKV